MNSESIAPPIPKLPRSQTYEQAFVGAKTLLVATQTAFAQRDEPYARSLRDKFLSLGLKLGVSCSEACASLAEANPFWSCVLARAYLEYGLRLLWAAREIQGTERMYAYYAHQHRDFMKAMAEFEPSTRRIFEEVEKKVPMAGFPEKMPYKLPSVLKAIGDADEKSGVHSLYRDRQHYTASVHFLHMFAHANPLFLQSDHADCVSHASRAVVDATTAVIRSVGHRLGWEQNAVTSLVYGISCLKSLGNLIVESADATNELGGNGGGQTSEGGTEIVPPNRPQDNSAPPAV